MNKGPKCPELVAGMEWMVMLCEKGRNTHGQSVSELSQFCKSKNYLKCPFYKDSRKSSFDIKGRYADRGVRANGI